MVSPIQRRILNALVVALKPLARALLASGIGYKEFSEVAKEAFVAVAASDYGIRGRPTNTSRISVITGLGRKEVKKVRDRGPLERIKNFVVETPASVVLHNWNNDPDYLNGDGQPIELPYKSSGKCFESLVSKYVGDIPPGALRTELKRVNAIEESSGGVLRVITPYFVPPGLGERLVIGLEDVASTMLNTLAYNCDPKREASPRFQRVASVDGIAPEFHAEIEEYAKDSLTSFGLDFCSYLDKFDRVDARRNAEEIAQLGIGLYFYNVGKPRSTAALD